MSTNPFIVSNIHCDNALLNSDSYRQIQTSKYNSHRHHSSYFSLCSSFFFLTICCLQFVWKYKLFWYESRTLVCLILIEWGSERKQMKNKNATWKIVHHSKRLKPKSHSNWQLRYHTNRKKNMWHQLCLWNCATHSGIWQAIVFLKKKAAQTEK